jgi:predicted peroxiredoxin
MKKVTIVLAGNHFKGLVAIPNPQATYHTLIQAIAKKKQGKDVGTFYGTGDVDTSIEGKELSSINLTM